MRYVPTGYGCFNYATNKYENEERVVLSIYLPVSMRDRLRALCMHSKECLYRRPLNRFLVGILKTYLETAEKAPKMALKLGTKRRS